MQLSYTIIFLVITAIISITAFSNREVYNKFILYPYIMSEPREYYRLLSSGFIHADWMHLAFNMFSFWAFGTYVEQTFAAIGKPWLFPLLYLGAIVASSLPDLVKHKNHSYFRSLGASGGVAAVLFSSVYFYPWEGIRIFPIPFSIPAIVFAGLYLIYSAYMSRRGGDNINHNAHFWGSVFGFVFTFLFDPTHGRVFFQQIIGPLSSL